MSEGRKTITCIKCSKPQKTHSTNRTLCHTCLPKCTEKHVFNKAVKKVQPSE